MSAINNVVNGPKLLDPSDLTKKINKDSINDIEIAKKIIEKSNVPLQEKLKTPLKAHTHVVSPKAKDYFMIDAIKKEESSVKIKNDIVSYENAPKGLSGVASKEEFKESTEKTIEEKSSSTKKVLNKVPIAQIPKTVAFKRGEKTIEFVLSRECIDGLEGKRGPDHKVEFGLFRRCLEKKVSKFLNIEQVANKRFAEYFNVSDGKESVLLLLLIVINSYADTKDLVVVTSYFPETSVVKCDRKLKTSQEMNDWVAKLPKVSINE